MTHLKKLIAGLGMASMLAMGAGNCSATILSSWGLAANPYVSSSPGNWTNGAAAHGVTGGGIVWSEGNDTMPANNQAASGPTGGEAYDQEYLAWRISGSKFQVLGVTSINPQTGTSDGFHAGDVFIDVNGDAASTPADTNHGYDLAMTNGGWTSTRGNDHLHPGDGLYSKPGDNNVSGATSNLYQIASVNDIHGITTSNGWGGYGTDPNSIPEQADPFAVRTGAAIAAGGTGAVTRTFETITSDNSSPNYAIQWEMDLSLLGAIDFTQLTLHWAVECGNDWINTFKAPDAPHDPSVPEPATLMLMGLGVTAMGAIRRRKVSAKQA